MTWQFIEPEHDIDRKAFQPAGYLRRRFDVGRDLAHGELSITACGLYKAYLNGEPVTDQVFTPGFTYYPRRLQYQSYDVTSLVRRGENVLAAVLGDGWYRGKIGVASRRRYYGEKTKLAARLTLTFDDGSQKTVVTDMDWRATLKGPIRKSDWKDGEVYDARQEPAGWNRPGFDDSDWHGVVVGSYTGDVVASRGEAILEQETFAPEVITTPDGSTVLDFKQNLFGYVAFAVTGPAGHEVTLRHGETLDEHGNFTLKNLHAVGPFIDKLRQEVVYTLREGSQHYRPSFTAHGFRYVHVENWPEQVVPENFEAIAVYSDLDQLGDFTCSDADINRLVENTRWSQKGNFVDIPTDCPTRERAGWSGDIAVFCETASYLMDTQRFLMKWLKDLALQQRSDGCVANIIPDVGLPAFLDGSAGWADAAIIVPHTLHRLYGNTDVLVEQYDSMTRWLAFVERRARKSSLLNRFKPNPYREFIVDTGYHWGEWLEPGHVMARDAVRNMLVPDAEVATAYYAYSARLLSEIAEVLGKDADADRYRELANMVKAAYRHTFTKDGLVESDRQCRYVRPVALDLLSESDKRRNVERLNRMVIANGYRIATGFLTTPFILPVLTDYGYVETAYRMAQNRERPGWLYEVDKGATTIWENWNGIDDKGVPRDSLNHYSLGAVTGWLFTRVAGITPIAPGFAKIQIKPVPGGNLSSVSCSYESAAGRIESAWHRSGLDLTFDISVPAETRLVLPDGTIHEVSPGSHTFTVREG